MNQNSGEEIEFVLNSFKFADLFFKVQQQIKMSFNGLRLEHALEGNSNYIAWKDGMEAVIENNILKEFITLIFPNSQ